MLDGESWKAKSATLAREIGGGWRHLDGVSWKARVAQLVGEVVSRRRGSRSLDLSVLRLIPCLIRVTMGG